MTSYVGKDLVCTWVTTAGTANLNTDYRNLSYSPTVDLIDETAGADTSKQYLTSFKDGQISYSGLMQAGGTAITNLLVEGALGTITIGPEGTAAGKQKITMAAICMGVNYRWVYNDLIEITCDFQQSGARTDGVY